MRFSLFVNSLCLAVLVAYYVSSDARSQFATCQQMASMRGGADCYALYGSACDFTPPSICPEQSSQCEEIGDYCNGDEYAPTNATIISAGPHCPSIHSTFGRTQFQNAGGDYCFRICSCRSCATNLQTGILECYRNSDPAACHTWSYYFQNQQLNGDPCVGDPYTQCAMNEMTPRDALLAANGSGLHVFRD